MRKKGKQEGKKEEEREDGTKREKEEGGEKKKKEKKGSVLKRQNVNGKADFKKSSVSLMEPFPNEN